MIIYPDIELQEGKCVNLWRGERGRPIVYDVAPVAAAQDFAEQGAEWLHVVDLDAVFGDGDNLETIGEIVRKAGCSVQVAGAIRTMDKVTRLLDQGVARVVIATAAVKDPAFVRQAASIHPDQVVVSVDARGGKVVCEGWRETTAFSPVEFARQFADVPLAAIVFTDIDRDDDLAESSLAQTAELAGAIKTPVIASGVVKSLDDISRLAYLPNIAGAITGRALFGKVFTLAEAIAVAASSHEPTAQFI